MTPETVRVELGERSYDIVIGRDILAGIGEALLPFRFSRRIALMSNTTVFPLYGDAVIDALQRAGFECFPLILPDGEEYKDYFWSYHAFTELLRKGLDRQSCLIALGGGVIGDMAGFVASLYMRGIPVVQVPTTLLAQVDSSVGGKTAVNHPLGKNMIGTFHQPRLVWIDLGTLRTLPRRQLLCGIAEVIKYGVIRDSGFFGLLEDRRDDILSLDGPVLAGVVRRSCEIKADVVARDEREGGIRAILNYGHTVGHAIETETNYTRFLHGEAVAIGMNLEARLSHLLHLLGDADAERIRSLIDAYGLPSELPAGLAGERLMHHMKLDKKTVGGAMRFVLPEKVGAVKIEQGITLNDLRRVLER